MKYRLIIFSACMMSAAWADAAPPVPVEDLSARQDALLPAQQRAGFANRQLEQARYETKLAEQDYLNAENAHRAAQKRADEFKRQAETAKRALNAAQAKEAAARKAYENALNAVDQLQRKSPAK